MQANYLTLHLKKRFPLAISRGVRAASDNLFISLSCDGITGWGEMSPGASEGAATPELAQSALQAFLEDDVQELSIEAIHDLARRENVPACAMAALDIALWDREAKKQEVPLYKLLNIDKPAVPTSVTVGINPPEIVKQRIPLLLEDTGIRSLKIKLGSPQGIEADKAMYRQVDESCRDYDVQLRVDANGGWDTENARHMMVWLAERGVEYVEQPLAEGNEDALPALFQNRALPIYIDESCRFAEDVEKWAHCVDGVNIKLMKCGGITGALRIIDAARDHHLKTMIGCMGESSMSISAAAALSGAIDHIDLDSHMNLDPDPCIGAQVLNGIVVPNDLPGHGASIKPQFLNSDP